MNDVDSHFMTLQKMGMKVNFNIRVFIEIQKAVLSLSDFLCIKSSYLSHGESLRRTANGAQLLAKGDF